MFWNLVEREIILTDRTWSSTSVFHFSWNKRWPNIGFTLTHRWRLMCWPAGTLGTWRKQDWKTSDKEVGAVGGGFRKESLEVGREWKYLCFVEYFPENKMICPHGCQPTSPSFLGACWKYSVTVQVWRSSMHSTVPTCLLHFAECTNWWKQRSTLSPQYGTIPCCPCRTASLPSSQATITLLTQLPSSCKREEEMDLRNTCEGRNERNWWPRECSRRVEKRNWDDLSL